MQRFKVLEFRFSVSGVSFRASGFRFRVQGLGVLDLGHHRAWRPSSVQQGFIKGYILRLYCAIRVEGFWCCSLQSHALSPQPKA